MIDKSNTLENELKVILEAQIIEQDCEMNLAIYFPLPALAIIPVV